MGGGLLQLVSGGCVLVEPSLAVYVEIGTFLQDTWLLSMRRRHMAGLLYNVHNACPSAVLLPLTGQTSWLLSNPRRCWLCGVMLPCWTCLPCTAHCCNGLAVRGHAALLDLPPPVFKPELEPFVAAVFRHILEDPATLQVGLLAFHALT